jgi:hypothetical protein
LNLVLIKRPTGKMKIILYPLLIVLLLIPAQTIAAQDGYSKTVQWWQGVRQKMVPYELQLQQMYAEVEASPGILPSKVRQEFHSRLAKEYPGSGYHGSSGYFKINNYTTLYFSRNWEISRLVQQIAEMNKSYDFNQNILALTGGSNRISFKLDLKSPKNSKFTLASIPAITATATRIYQTRPDAVSSRDGMSDILNDVYHFNISTFTASRMDEFAEHLVTDVSTRETVLSQAQQLYQDPPEGLVHRPDGGSILPRLNVGADSAVPSGQNIIAAVLGAIPWYAYLLFFGFVFANGFAATRRVKRYSKGLSLFEELIRHLFANSTNKTSRSYDEDNYESKETLNSPAEQKFQVVLEDVLDQSLYTLNGKTRLADILKVKNGIHQNREQSAFNRIKSKHVDFVITEKHSSRIVGVIELDDRSHLRADRRKRDQLVDQWLKGAGIPILHYPCRRDYSFVDLQRALTEVFGIPPQPFGDFS